MANIIQRRRGNTAQHATFTGAEGEITIDLDKETVVVHDGATAGGFPLAREDMTNVADQVGIPQLKLSDGTVGQVLQTDGAGTISFTSQPDVTGSSVGGDLTGTVGNAHLGANTVGVVELNLSDGTSGQVLMTDGAGNISFGSTVDVSSAVVGGDLSGTVGNAQLVVNSVTTAELAGDAVETVNIKDLNVTNDKLATDSVTAIKIVDGAVTNDKILSLSSAKLVGAMPALDGNALTNINPNSHTHINPYDVSFLAGYDIETLPIDIVVQKYGEMVMARTGTFEGEQAHIEVGPAGSALIIDIEKNGASIYSTKPQYADAAGAGGLTAGVLSTTDFAAGDRVTFRVTQVGSGTAGTGLRFMMKCKV